MSINSKSVQILESLSDQESRKQFIDEDINVGIAFQIRAIRNRQDLTQPDLAKLLGVKQPLVSSWENPNYGKYSLTTLKNLAKAFDVGLLVRFVSFGTMVDKTVDLKPLDIAPPSFAEEQAVKDLNICLDKIFTDANKYSNPEPTEPDRPTNLDTRMFEPILRENIYVA